MPIVKKIAFSFIAMVIVPLLFFVVLELGLALSGIGNSYDYFHEIDIDGQTHFQENPDFANQFYPASLNIGPVENTFSKQRRSDSVRIFILGGSAALGFPYKNHGLDRLLATQLRAALPGREIEVINTAMTSVNSHVVYAVANSLPNDSADFAVVLMGNNEVVGPYGPGTFNQNFLTNINLLRTIQSLKRTRTWQVLDSIILKLRPTDAKRELKWQGMQMFTDHGVPYDDARLQGVYSHFEDNLVDVVETLQDKGMHVLLSSVPVNLRHSAPFMSVRSPGLSADQLEQWRIHTRQGAEHAAAANWNDAAAQFESALSIDPNYADTHFRLASAYENQGDHQKARSHYRRALDLDALRFRTDTSLAQTILDVAVSLEGEALSFVDSAAAFERASMPYQPGWNLFLEHVHYDFAGNNILAAELSSAIVRTLTGLDTPRPLASEEVARRIGFPNYDTIAEIQNLQGMIQHPPFPGQSNYLELAEFLEDKVKRMTMAVGSQQDVIQRRSGVAMSGLADWKVYFELAVLNQRLDNQSAAWYYLNKVVELYPHNRESYLKLAEAANRAGKWAESIPYLEKSFYYTRGDESKIAESTNWLGTAHLRTGNYDAAEELLSQMPRKFPDQIDLNLRAFGNLIKFSRERNDNRELARHIDAVQRYARSLIRNGKDKEYPLLYQRMSQIMTLGGYDDEAAEWTAAQSPTQ